MVAQAPQADGSSFVQPEELWKAENMGGGGEGEVKVAKIPEGKDVFFSTVYSEHQSFLLWLLEVSAV